MMISEILEKESGISLDKLCVSIDLVDIIYPLCFIRTETDDFLVVDSTGDDGNERIVVIKKDRILTVNVVYQQDISLGEKKVEDKMFR